jgi:hypothetical protein
LQFGSRIDAKECTRKTPLAGIPFAVKIGRRKITVTWDTLKLRLNAVIVAFNTLGYFHPLAFWAFGVHIEPLYDHPFQLCQHHLVKLNFPTDR